MQKAEGEEVDPNREKIKPEVVKVEIPNY